MRAIPRPTSDTILLGYSVVYIVVIVYNNIIDIVDGRYKFIFSVRHPRIWGFAVVIQVVYGSRGCSKRIANIWLL